MIHAPGVIVRLVFYKLLEPPDIMQQGYGLSQAFLIGAKPELLSEKQHFIAGPSTVVLLELQVGVYVVVIGVEFRHVIIKPNLEQQGFKNISVSQNETDTFIIQCQKQNQKYELLF